MQAARLSASHGARVRVLLETLPVHKMTRPQSLQAAVVGKRVLAGAAKGRQLAAETIHERAVKLVLDVIAEYNRLAANGQSRRGMSGKIARRLGNCSERHVRRILKKYSDTQGRMSDSVWQTPREEHELSQEVARC